MRFTGLRPIEINGLKGFGFSIQFTDQIGGNGTDLPILSATEKQRACGNGSDQSSSQVSSSQPAEPAGEVSLLQAQTSPATPLNPRPHPLNGGAQTASAGDTAASLSYSDGDA